MTISVVIPCNNVESFIGSTVRSVLSQTLSPTQIICVDDGSTDGTRDILRDFEAKGAPLTVISQVNQGSNVARNVGLEHVEGEYTQFLDADDILHPEKLEHQAHLIASQDTKPDFVAAAYEKLPVDEAYEGIKGAVGINEDPWSGLILITLGITSANLWKTAAVRSVGGGLANLIYAKHASVIEYFPSHHVVPSFCFLAKSKGLPCRRLHGGVGGGEKMILRWRSPGCCPCWTNLVFTEGLLCATPISATTNAPPRGSTPSSKRR